MRTRTKVKMHQVLISRKNALKGATKSNEEEKQNYFAMPVPLGKVSIAGFENFMAKNHVKKDGKPFKSAGIYGWYLRHALKAFGIGQSEFCLMTNPSQLKRMREKLINELRSARSERRKKYARNSICAFDSFTEYVVCQRLMASLVRNSLTKN